MSVLFILFLAALLAVVIWLFLVNRHYYSGPIKPHFDGKHFHNLTPGTRRTFLDFLKWWYLGRKAPSWPSWVEYSVKVNIKPKVTGKDLVVTFVNHSTVLIQTAGLNILTDPVWSDRLGPYNLFGPKRVHAPGVQIHQLPTIDVMLISHNHFDHLDPKTVKTLWKRDKPLILTGLGVEQNIFDYDPDIRVETLDWGQSYQVSKQVDVVFETAHHWSARGLFDRNKTLWGSFVIKTPSGNLFFAGDSGYAGGVHYKALQKKYKSFLFAMLPIGSYLPQWFMKGAHLNPEEAVLAHKDLNAQFSLAIHYGTFPLADEAHPKPLEDLKKALKDEGVSSKAFFSLRPGESKKLL